MNEFAPVPIFQQGWSLGVEEKFYLLWPLLGFVLWRKNTKARLAGTVVLILLPVAVSYLISLRAPSFAVVWVAGYGMIMTGCLLAQSLHIRGSFERLRFLARPAWARSAVLLLLTFYVVTAWFPKKSTPQAATVAFFFAIAVAIFLIPTLITRTPWTGFLESRVLVFIGRRSYAIYLVHMLAVNIAVRVAPRFQSDLLTSIVWLTAAFGFSILVSDLLHRAVERPMIAFGRSLTGARSPAVAGVS
jgi:peptidoglycan/LPS O-acetylase OafA/YrhL